MTPLRRRVTMLLASLSGSALALPALAQTQTGTVTSQIQAGLTSAASGYGTPIPLPQLIGSLVGVALTLLGVLLLCYLLYGGYLWMTAQGDEGRVKKARALITNAIIGLVIIVAAYSIANFVLGSLSNVTTGTSSGQVVNPG